MTTERIEIPFKNLLMWSCSSRSMASRTARVGDEEQSTAPAVPRTKEEEVATMDSSVWADLPEELLVAALTRLPWWSNLRLRLVCKKWSGMLRDIDFLAAAVSLPSRRAPFCVVNCAEGVALFNPRVSRWRFLPLSWLLETPETFEVLDMKASAGGLLVIEGTPQGTAREQADRPLFLVNPLNGTHRRLPTLPEPEPGFRCHIVGVGVDEATRNCKVIAVQSQELQHEIEERPRRIGRFYYLPVSGTRPMWKPINHPDLWKVYVYESRTNSWECIFNLQNKIGQNLASALLVRHELYLLTLRQSGIKPVYRVCRAGTTDWDELPGPPEFTTQDIVCVHLFEHEGSLMLVGATKEYLRDRLPNVDLWRLDKVHDEWIKVVSMPEEMVKVLVRLSHREANFHKRLFNETYKQAHRTDSFDFFAEGDHLVFSNIITEVTVTWSMVTREWTVVPHHQCTCWKFHGFYQPTYFYSPSVDIVL